MGATAMLAHQRRGYLGESGFYANNWPQWRKNKDESIRAMLSGAKPLSLQRSLEYGADIIEMTVRRRCMP